MCSLVSCLVSFTCFYDIADQHGVASTYTLLNQASDNVSHTISIFPLGSTFVCRCDPGSVSVESNGQGVFTRALLQV